MDKAAKDRNLTVTDYRLDRADRPVAGVWAALPIFMSALFSARRRTILPPLVATPVGYAIYQVTEIQPAQTPTFEQIKAKVEEQFSDQRAQALLAPEDPGTVGPRPR